MRDAAQWTARSRGLLKAELVKRGISYKELGGRLRTLGVTYTTESLTNRINRGRFSAVFLLQCLEAVDCSVLRLKDE